MIKPFTLATLLLAFLLSPLLHAEPSESAVAQRVEQLDSSVKALFYALEEITDKQADAESQQTLDSTQQHQTRAEAFKAREDYDQAASELEAALSDLRVRIAEVRGGGEQPTGDGGNPDHLDAKYREDINHLNDSVNALMGALVAISEEKGRADLAEEIGQLVRQHQETAELLTRQDALGAAREELNQALVTVKTAIATLRNRETLVRSLDFANKEEEFRYELDRYETYLMLVQLLIDKKHLEPAALEQMDVFKREARTRHASAEAAAKAGDFDKAVTLQEQSNRNLLQAIRRGGLYVPG